MLSIGFIACEAVPFFRAVRYPPVRWFIIVHDTTIAQCTDSRRTYRCNLCAHIMALRECDWPRIVYSVPIATGGVIKATGHFTKEA